MSAPRVPVGSIWRFRSLTVEDWHDGMVGAHEDGKVVLVFVSSWDAYGWDVHEWDVLSMLRQFERIA